MKKIFTLLTAFAMTATFASAEIFTVKGPNDGIIGQGAVLDNTGSAIVVTSISATTAKNKDMKTGTEKFPDGTLANTFCMKSTKLRLGAAPTVENPDGTVYDGCTAFKIVVNEDIKSLNLYAEGAPASAANKPRAFSLFNRATGEIETKSFAILKGEGSIVAGTNIGYIATWTDVAVGEYTLYVTGFGAGFCGITYETAGAPAPISWSENSTTIQLGSEYTLPTFSNTDPEIAVSFVSSNPEVATVSESGEISLVGNGVGIAVITATYEGEKYDKTEVSCEITVVSTVDPEFAFSAAEVTVNFGGDMSSLPTLVMSEDIAASDVTYSVTPAGIAEVKDGIINVLAAGKATITATFAGNDKYSSATATCVVTALPQKEIKVGEVVLAIGEIGDLVEYTDKNGNPATKYVVAAGTNIFDDANITVTNISATLRANDSKNICGADMTNYIQVRNQNEDNTELTITPKANMEFVVYGRLQDKSTDQPVIQNTKNFALNESGSALNSTMHFSEWLVGGAEKPYEYFLMAQSFALEAGKTYTLTAGGFGFRLYGFSYTAEAPAEIAAPTHNQEGETVKVNGSQEVVFTPAADHHVVYTYFEAATAPEGGVETQAAAETVEHEGKTFTLAADNKVTVDKSGTLHYFAMDPETGVKSPINTIAFDVTTGIADIDVDSENAPVEYFNMQGIRVANPQNGLYIRRQGNKVEKIYVK